MTDEYLLERGYKEYPTLPFDSNFVVARYQKRFDDNIGKKYFINAVKHSWYDVPEHKRNKWWVPFTYEYEVQVTMLEEENPINLQFFSGWSLEEVETFMAEFFNKMYPNYYEIWDEC